jgi:hypothetical protein
MSKAEYAKYITYQTDPGPWHPRGTPGSPLFIIEDNVVKGAFHLTCGWWTTATAETDVYGPHYHDADEYLALIGSNPEDQIDLGGEVEFWYDEEKYLLTKTCALFIPKGLWHAPLIFRKVDRPILLVSTLPTTKVTVHYNHDPKWSRFKKPPAGAEGVIA